VQIVSAITGAGVMGHFVHADDVYDPYRSKGLNWEELKSNFDRMFKFVRRHYPWLRFVTMREAHQILSSIDASGAEFKWRGDRLLLYTTPGLLLRVRLNDRKLKRTEGVEVVYRYKRSDAVVVRTTEPQATLYF
jgi:hypothetical protein